MENSIQLNLKPSSSEIEKAGQESGNFFKSHGFSDEAIDKQIMILTKLIDSGIKYGKLPSSDNEITINIDISEKAITFEVKNPVDETCFDRLKELDQTIQFLRGYQDPFEPYLIKQREAGQNPSDNSELELAKLAYESGAILDFFVGEDNFMNLFAVRNF